jgi:hypothetical protein
MKVYQSPKIIRIELDNTISLCMMSHPDHPPHPEHPPHPHKNAFESPFADKPFN